MAKIFVSYRRDDDPNGAARVRDALAARFGQSSIFMDVDNLLAGLRFDDELAKALAACDIFIAILGSRWLELLKARTASGERDYVCEEIAGALKRKIAVIPVRVGRDGQLAPLPRPDDLPPAIRDLVHYQKHDVTHEHFGRDAGALAEAIVAVRRHLRPARANVVSAGWMAAGAVCLLMVGYVGAYYSGVPVPWPRLLTDREGLPPRPDARDARARQASAVKSIRLEAKIGGNTETGVITRTSGTDWVWEGGRGDRYQFKTFSEQGSTLVLYDQSREMYHRFELDTSTSYWRQGSGAWNQFILPIVAVESQVSGPAVPAPPPAEREAKARADDAATQAKREQEARDKTERDAAAKRKADEDAEARRAAAEQRKREVDAEAAAKAKAEVDRLQAAALAKQRAEEEAAQRDAVAALAPGSGQAARDRLASGEPCPMCPEMVLVPTGSFTMGSPASEPGRYGDEGPPHKVTIAKPFAVGKFEVTFDEWDACVADRGCTHKPAARSGRGKQPVINVSWDDAQQFVKWLSGKTGKSYRLLTEAEWEYAARAGTTTPFWWGATITPAQANYNGESYAGGPTGGNRGQALPVDSFEPNPWGLYNVHGNVSEWVEDCDEGGYKGAPTDGSAARETAKCSRVLRGGGWNSNPQFLRSADRGGDSTGNRNSNLGFRLARTIMP